MKTLTSLTLDYSPGDVAKELTSFMLDAVWAARDAWLAGNFPAGLVLNNFLVYDRSVFLDRYFSGHI